MATSSCQSKQEPIEEPISFTMCLDTLAMIELTMTVGG